MLSKILENKFKILGAILIIFSFMAIRAFENQLFYDPFLKFFEVDFKNSEIPSYDSFRLFLGAFFRYFLNSILSLALIYILFQNEEILKFSTFMYVFFLVILFAMFFWILKFQSDATWLLFYVRRFIIQPIFVLLFIPAFYYQQQNLKK